MPPWKIFALFTQVAAWKTYTQTSVAHFCKLQGKTVSQWCVYLREALAVFNHFQPVIIGGKGKKVFIDEVLHY